MVPEPDVLDRRGIARDIVACQHCVPREFARLDRLETKRAPRRVDVVLDEGGLPCLLVWRHDKPLQDRAVALAANGDDEIQRHGRRNRPIARRERLEHGKRGANHADGRKEQRCGHPAVDVRVSGSIDHSRRLNEPLRLAQPGAERQEQQEYRREQREMTPRSGRHPRHGPEARCQAAGHEIERGGTEGREQHQPLRQAADKLEKRQREHVERHVAPENGIGLPERHGVAPCEPCLPLRRGEQRDDAPENGGDSRGDHAQLLPAGQRHFDPLPRGEDGPLVTNRGERHPEIGRQPGGRYHERNHEQGGLGAQHGEEDLLVADLAEPEPIGIDADKGGTGKEDEGQHREKEEPNWSLQHD